MKKIILFLTAIVLLQTTTKAQLKFGIKTGGNIAELRINGQSDLFTNDDFKGFHAGIISDFEIAENIYIQPQAIYSRRGASLMSASSDGISKLRMNYVDLGANFLYKYPVGGGKIFLAAGPALGYSFFGRIEQNGEKEKLYADTDNWKRFDVNVNMSAGFELNNGLFASINSQKGLLNIYRPGAGSVKHRSVSISIGYFINNKTKKA